MTIKKSLQEFKRTHQDNWQVSSFLFHTLKNLFLSFGSSNLFAGAQDQVHGGPVGRDDRPAGEPELLRLSYHHRCDPVTSRDQ